MKRFLVYTTVGATFLFPAIAPSQESDETTQEAADRGYLEALIEDNLSNGDFAVDIVDFQGALSSRATVAELRISDAQGTWLTLRGVELDWNRSALLRGQLDVTELSAQEIIVPRLPGSSSDAPSPEASPFALPELPVGVQIGRIAAERVELGEPILGQIAILSVEGSAQLAEGSGNVSIAAQRLDGASGAFGVEGSFDNATRILALDVSLEEGENGIAASLLGLPGQPSVALNIDGEGPLSDFTADIGLATDGQDRISGTVALLANDDGEPGTSFTADISGDIRPLLEPESREFFGEDLSLKVDGTRYQSGALDLTDLTVTSDAINISGSAAFGEDLWPSRVALTGDIVAPEGGKIELPIPGEVTRLDRADLDILYNAETSDDWSARIEVVGLDRPTLSARLLRIDGAGSLSRGEGTALGQMAGTFDVQAESLEFTDPNLSQAVGTDATGNFDVSYIEDAPFKISNLTLSGAGTDVAGDLEFDGLGDDLNLIISGDLRADVDDISRFSGLAQREVAGAADVRVVGNIAPLSGGFDAVITGSTRDLIVGIEQLDTLVAGQTELTLSVLRDENGITLRDLTTESSAAKIEANGLLASDNSEISFDARLTDLGDVLQGANGATSLTGVATQTGPRWGVDLKAQAPGQTAVDATLGLLLIDGELSDISGQGTLSANDLSVWSTIANRPLGGGVEATANGRYSLPTGHFNVAADGILNSPKTGIAEADRILEGRSTFKIDAIMDALGLTVSDFNIIAPRGSVQADGLYTPDGDGSRITFTSELTNLNDIFPDMSGSAYLNGNATQSGETLDYTVQGAGPGGSKIDVAGQAEIADFKPTEVTAEGAININDLSPLSGLVGQSLGGAAQLSGSGSVDLTDGSFASNVRGQTVNLRTGIDAVNKLMRGTADLTAILERSDTGTIKIDTLTVDATEFDIQASGSSDDQNDVIRFSADLRDVGLFAPDFSGPASATGTARRSGETLFVDTVLNAAGGTTATINGTVAQDGSTANLTIDGNAPLGLANFALTPNVISGTSRFDLRLNGPLQLSSLSGRIATENASLTVPTQALAFDPLTATIDLNAGRAQIDVEGRSTTGGRIQVNGPVSLEAPFNGDLNIRLRSLGFEDPSLYATTVEGRLNLNGPLASTARLSGTVDLGQTEIRVPSGGIGSTALTFQLAHVNEPAAVRTSRARAGLLDTAEAKPEGLLDYPLDVTVNAPSRIFVRGRGLDAELGGQVRVGGSLKNVTPTGRFDLIRGRLDILGQRLTLSEASIVLQGDLDPYLQVRADASRADTEIQVNIVGPVSDPEVSFTSSPDRPEEEVLALLLFGRDLTQISGLQALRIAAALNTLAGRSGNSIIDNIRMSTGLDDLDVQTSEDGTTELQLGKYINDRTYTDVTVGSDGTSEINLNLTVTPNITARGTVASDGNTGVGVYFEKDY